MQPGFVSGGPFKLEAGRYVASRAMNVDQHLGNREAFVVAHGHGAVHHHPPELSGD